MSKIFDGTIDTLSRSMDLYLLRHSVTADNIANAETPFFKARRVEFESALQSAVDSAGTNGNEGVSVTDVQPRIVEDIRSESGQDHNTVDMDREMADMTKNDLKYSAAAQSISKKFALLKYAASDGGDR